MNIFDLIIVDKNLPTIDEIYLSNENKFKLQTLIKEHRYVEELMKYHLPINNKILLSGDSGCGKTMTAKSLAHALKKPIYIVNLSNIVNSRIGETSQNMKLIFDKVAREKAILFIDEFDHIAKARGNDDKDVGEMRRMVNTLIQLIDYLPADTLLICATNHQHIIDQALVRRFQLTLTYHLPDKDSLDLYYNDFLKKYPSDITTINRKYNISYAEAKDHLINSIKENLIHKLEQQSMQNSQ